MSNSPEAPKDFSVELETKLSEISKLEYPVILKKKDGAILCPGLTPEEAANVLSGMRQDGMVGSKNSSVENPNPPVIWTSIDEIEVIQGS